MSIENTREQLISLINSALDIDGLEKIRVDIFGKNGELNKLKREIVNIPVEQKKQYGQKMNSIKTDVENSFESQKNAIEMKILNEKIAKEKIDVTLPGHYVRSGSMHPVTRVLYELCEVFKTYGFSVEDGPEIECEDYNFDKLNIPADHPARDMQDTFFMENGYVLRTHTSPVQVRTMLNSKPPIKIVSPGRVYRKDDIDATHTPIFHQIEGLYIAQGVTFADLKGILMRFLKDYYGENTQVRFQPSYFPFTEPSAEVYISCVACHGEGKSHCPVCKNTGFIEIMGCGMVHPQVLTNCGIDSENYSGFAFGMGIERIAMLKYKIKDIRYLYDNDMRFLKNFVR
ncbi:MAG: phenylalanine--tRNA ligase subunit alpha [Candidatus Muirbacterium halophilum]|nr:phenylalanine--tRNA ligase subunit alpha [Candidatus Muirbacterium halophilum]MCK9476059.1 phenylalanine--tRNA ligase subunit alpha [Candidatus Muirbacterium halophilum]